LARAGYLSGDGGQSVVGWSRGRRSGWRWGIGVPTAEHARDSERTQRETVLLLHAGVSIRCGSPSFTINGAPTT
jgi:hypothetical protein